MNAEVSGKMVAPAEAAATDSARVGARSRVFASVAAKLIGACKAPVAACVCAGKWTLAGVCPHVCREMGCLRVALAAALAYE